MKRPYLPLWLLLLLISSPWRADAGGEIPAEVFFQHPVYLDAKISPTGQYLAVTKPHEGQTILTIVDWKKREVTGTIHFNDRNEHVHRFWWASDRRVVFTTAIQTGSVDYPRLTGDIYAMDVDGSNQRLLYGWRIRDKSYQTILDPLPEDPKHILVLLRPSRLVRRESTRPQVEKVDVYGGVRPQDTDSYTTTGTRIDPKKRDVLERSPISNGWLATDHTGQVRIATGVVDGNVALYCRRGEGHPWQDLSERFGRHVLGARGDITPLHFNRENTKLYVLREVEGATRRLELLDPETASVEPIFEVEGFDIAGEDLIWDHRGEEVVGVSYISDLPHLQQIDPKDPSTRLARALSKAHPNHWVSVTSSTRSGSHALAYVGSDRYPGAFFLYDMEAKTADRLFDRRPAIDPEQMLPMHPISLRARDETPLHGYLTLPRGGAAANLPMIVLVHGGPHGVRDWFGFDPEVQFFASRGYAVLQVNYRGSDGYGHDFESAGFRQWGRAMQDDVTDATHWAIQEGVADPERICIYGASYGAYSALMGVIREPELYRCAAAYAGVYDLGMMFEKGDIVKFLPGGEEYLEMVLGRDEAVLDANSPVERVDEIQVPLFLAHGKEDERAPYAHYKRLTKKLKKAKKPFVSFVKSGEGHGFWNVDARVELYTKMLAFFDEHTAPPSRPRSAP
jgi:dipeptidyl aminopeptidase/acylaminoacyl peptidase